jgi:hypothetical protein
MAMTRKTKASAAGPKKGLRLRKETLKDLAPASEGVRGGYSLVASRPTVPGWTMAPNSSKG